MSLKNRFKVLLQGDLDEQIEKVEKRRQETDAKIAALREEKVELKDLHEELLLKKRQK